MTQGYRVVPCACQLTQLNKQSREPDSTEQKVRLVERDDQPLHVERVEHPSIAGYSLQSFGPGQRLAARARWRRAFTPWMPLMNFPVVGWRLCGGPRVSRAKHHHMKSDQTGRTTKPRTATCHAYHTHKTTLLHCIPQRVMYMFMHLFLSTLYDGRTALVVF